MTTATLEKRVRALEQEMKSLTVAKKARAKLRSMILEGLNSGAGVEISAHFWKKKRALIRNGR